MLSKLAAGQAWRDDPVTHWAQPVSRYVESEKVPGTLLRMRASGPRRQTTACGTWHQIPRCSPVGAASLGADTDQVCAAFTNGCSNSNTSITER